MSRREVSRRGFLGWLAAVPALAWFGGKVAAAPKPAVRPWETGGSFGPLNPLKPGERSFWSRDPDYAVGMDMASGPDFTVVGPTYRAECHEAGDNVTLGEDDLYMKQPTGDGFVVWRRKS